MDETPENLFIFNLSEASQLKEYFNSISIHPKKLLKDKISTICIGVSVIERTIEMTFNLNVFDPSIIMEKMKNINMMDY